MAIMSSSSGVEFFDILRSLLLNTRDFVSSPDDLLERCHHAMDLRMSTLPFFGEECCRLQLGITSSLHVNAEELSRLKPLYQELLADVQEKEAASEYLAPLFSTLVMDPLCGASSEDSPCLLLYFLIYPILVRFARITSKIEMSPPNDSGSLYADNHSIVSSSSSGSQSMTSYASSASLDEIYDVANAVTRDKTISQYCRAVIRKPWDHHPLALLYSITMMRSIFLLPSSREIQLCIRKGLFRGRRDMNHGLKELQADLARAVLLESSSFDILRSALLLLHEIESYFKSGDEIRDTNRVYQLKTLACTPYKESFEEALRDHAHSYPPDELQCYQCLLGLPLSGVQQAGTATKGLVYWPKWRLLVETPICEAKDCCNSAPIRCKGCQLVAYCSPACQKADWDQRHVHFCCRKDKKHQVFG